MALTVVPVHQAEFDQPDASNLTVKPVVIQFDSSYPLSGYPTTPSTFGFTTKVLGVLLTPGGASRAGFQLSQDPITGNIRIFDLTPAAGSPTRGGKAQRATDISAWSEVASATNLSGVRVRALAVGY